MNKHIIGYALTAIIGVGIGAAIGGSSSDAEVLAAETTTTTVETTTTTSTTTTTTTTTTTIPTTTTAAFHTPLEPSDFEIELVVLRDACFGSAGANVTVEPELFLAAGLTQAALAVRADGRDHLIIFEIHGVEVGRDEEGSETNNLTLHADGSYTFREIRLSTLTCDHNLSAEVVQVRPR